MHSAQSLIDRLYGIFTPIYLKWKEWAPHELYLWHDTAHKNAITILQEDIRSLGEYFASQDMIGARTEYTLTAECLAVLRIMSRNVPITKSLLEQEIDKACRLLEHESKSEHVRYHSGNELPQPYNSPMTWRMCHHLAAAGRCSPEVLESLYQVYVDLAHLFLLRDGNITPEEDIGWKQFHAAFKK